MNFSTILAGSTTLAILIIVLVLYLVTDWKVFVKMGEPGWKSLIPFYSLYVQCKHVWSKTGFWMTLVLSVAIGVIGNLKSISLTVSIIGTILLLVLAVLEIIFSHFKSRAFGKGVGTTLLMIFLPFIANLYLGFGAAEYEGNKAVK